MGQIGKAREGRWCRDRLARRPFENSKGESMMIEAERGLGRDKLHGRRRLLAAGMRRRHSVGTTLPDDVIGRRSRFASYAPKKNVLLCRMGPPVFPPN